ncbi:MAG TPA: hypothetical protein VLJ59_02135 [Mycobacteriales bacterium]|nr:hypothetical protein [Mycobacteriales bacterium]
MAEKAGPDDSHRDKDGSTRPGADTDKTGDRTGRTADSEPKNDQHHTDPLSPPDDSVSEKDALSALLGESDERLDAARSAEIYAERRRRRGQQASVGTLNVFNAGISVDGNVNLGVAEPGRVRPNAGPVPVDSAHLADYTTAYIEPPGFDDALAVLEQRHLLVLAAADGTGRETAALVLLRQALAASDGEPVLFELAPGGVFDDKAWAVPAEGAGYVVADPRTTASDPRQSASLDDLKDAWLTRTSAALSAASSFMVIITGPLHSQLATVTRRADFVVEHLGKPDLTEIVRRRVLAAGTSLTVAELDCRLVESGVAELMAEQPWPRFAVRVATLTAKALNEGGNLTTVLDGLRNRGGQVRDWFDHHTEPGQVAFAIATAVLNDSSYLTLSDAAVELWRALTEEEKNPPRPRFRRALETEQPWIEVTDPVRSTDGSVHPETVRFRDSDLWLVVLGYAWKALDGIRPVLVDWLRGLVGHPDIEVSARAGMAAGVLAADDYQHTLHRLLVPWAGSRSSALRRTAAMALGIVVDEVPPYSRQVWALLRRWADDSSGWGASRNLRMTAALAAGGPLGVGEPDRALRVLRTLLRTEDWALMHPVALAVHLLVEGGRSAEVLRALLDWTEPGSGDSLEVMGLVAFVYAARQPRTASRSDAVDPDDDDVAVPAWPILLAEAGRHPDELPELWGRALDNRTVQDNARAALREWLRVVDDDWTAYHRVEDVLAGVADRDQRSANRLDSYLCGWAEDEDDPSEAADQILKALADASWPQ